MKLTSAWLFTVTTLTFLSAGCSGTFNAVNPLTRSYSFTTGITGWDFNISDYTSDTLPDSVEFTHAPIPRSGAPMALYIGGRNYSSDLLLYARRQLTDLQPNTKYTATIETRITTDSPLGCVGVGGGTPGESVWLIAAVSSEKPATSVSPTGYVSLKIDRGNQSLSGRQSDVLGIIGTAESPCVGGRTPVDKGLKGTKSIPVTPDDQGKLWLTIGVDSGYEGYSRIWIQDVTVTFKPVMP